MKEVNELEQSPVERYIEYCGADQRLFEVRVNARSLH
jgi:hypothetical protein